MLTANLFRRARAGVLVTLLALGLVPAIAQAVGDEPKTDATRAAATPRLEPPPPPVVVPPPPAEPPQPPPPVVEPPPPPPASTYAPTVLGDGPAAYWRLGEHSGATALDSSPTHGSPGRYLGGVKIGVLGAIVNDTDTAAFFDGRNDVVQIHDESALHVGDSFSLEVWIKRSVTSKSQELLNKGRKGFQLVVLNKGSGNRVLLRQASVASIAQSKTGIRADGKYHHIVATKQGPNSARIYVDGTDVTLRPRRAKNLVIRNTKSPLYVGDGARASIDEIAIYNGVLTATQVRRHYQDGLGVATN